MYTYTRTIHTCTYNVQHSQAQLEPEARYVAEFLEISKVMVVA